MLSTVSALVLGVGGASAQEEVIAEEEAAETGAASASEEDALEEEDRLIVTGSRILRNPLNEPAQILSLGEADLEATGLLAVGDILQRLPYSGGTFNTRFNNSGNFGFPPDGGGIGAGSAQADLRNLGPKRVLVLVDGKRWINESSASGVSSAVDLNTIPRTAVERIEVLPEGASPIYGSDAIGGVVNIITKRDFEGFEASSYWGAFDEGDGETQEYNLSYGAIGERTRIFADVSYVRADDVKARDRDISAFPTPGVGQCTPFCSSGTPQGRFVFSDPRVDRNGDGIADTLSITLNDGVLNNGIALPFYNVLDPANGDDFNPFDTSDRFNFSQFNLVQTPSERLSFFTQVEHDLTDYIKVELKALYNNRESRNQAAPEPLFIGPDAGNGNILDTISVDVTNPFNPFGITLDAGPGGNFIFAGRRPLEAGPRIFEQNVDTYYVNGGLVGEFDLHGRTYYWDAHVTYSESNADQTKIGGFNSARLKQALGPIDQCINPDTGESIGGCVPFNLFGGQGPDGQGSITPEMLDFVGFIQQDKSSQELFAFTANLTGDIVELPGGTAAFAVGYERRTRRGSFQPDAVVVAGESAGVPSTPTSGEFDVDEVYGEVVVPLLSDLPLVDYLEVNSAVRYSNYSTFDGETTYKFAGKWRPTEDLLFRAAYAEGLRAPGIGELFGSLARFDDNIQDPCSDLLGLQGGPVASPEVQANCIAQGVPADGSYQQFNQQISVQTGGNRALEPEESESISAAVVYSPAWVAERGWGNVLLEVNYFDIEVTGAIQAGNAQDLLDTCVAQGLVGGQSTCNGFLTRTAGGVINSFANQLQNIAGIETDGFDFRLDYEFPETPIGFFSFRFLGTYTNEFTETLPSANGTVDLSREGTLVGSTEQGFPQFRSTAWVDWMWNDWAASLTVRYLSSLDETCPASLSGVVVNGRDLSTLCSDPAGGINELDATVYTDVQVQYTPGFLDSRVGFTLGVINLTDTDPPECLSCALNGFSAPLYDVPGRFGYARLTLKM